MCNARRHDLATRIGAPSSLLHALQTPAKKLTDHARQTFHFLTSIVRQPSPHNQQTTHALFPRLPAPPDGMRVHGWRWHHIAILNDLIRLHKAVIRNASALCVTHPPRRRRPRALLFFRRRAGEGEGGAEGEVVGRDDDGEVRAAKMRIALNDAVQFILVESWQLHDAIEQNLLFPWLHRLPATPTDRNLLSATTVRVARARNRLRRRVDVIRRLSRDLAQCAPPAVGDARRAEGDDDAKGGGGGGGWSSGTGRRRVLYGECGRRVAALNGQIGTLTRDAYGHFAAVEGVVGGYIARNAGRKEQKAFGDSVLRWMTGRQARVMLVLFNEALAGGRRVLMAGSREDGVTFAQEVPAAVRGLGVPVWRRKFVAGRMRFVGEEGRSGWESGGDVGDE